MKTECSQTKSEHNIIWDGKGKMVTLIKKGLISAKVCEALEGCTLLKVGPSVPKV